MDGNWRYSLLKVSLTVLGKLPDWFMYYPMRWIVFVAIYRIARYRLRVVRDNMRSSFRGMPKEELRRIERAFYVQLSEVMIDSVRSFGISRRKYERRMKFTNLQQTLDQTQGKDYVLMLGHYGFWEYSGALKLHTEAQVLGVYHPLANRLLDRLMIETRSRFGNTPVPMKLLLRYIVQCRAKGVNFVVGLIADQNTYDSDAYWCDFLGHKTAFVNGGAKIAHKFSMPVYYLDVVKVGRARYQGEFRMIYDGVEDISNNEITKRYVTELEKTIMRAPEYWMWSHKRWKREPPKELTDGN